MPEAAELDFVALADLALKAILGIVGAYLAHSLHRQLRVRVAEKRLAAYAALWEKMVVATPVRLAPWSPLPLTRAERRQLYRDFTEWYYKEGNGMLVAGNTRAIYLRAKDNLICPLEEFQPASLREKVLALPTEEARQCARGLLSVRQLSLLRTRMKADLAVYGPPYHRDLNADDRAFLRSCGENLTIRPWRGALLPRRADTKEQRELDVFAYCRTCQTKEAPS